MHTASLAPHSRRHGKDPSTALLHRHPETGEIHAKSTGTSGVVYVVTIGETLSCTCPAGRNGRTCYHVIAAAQRFPAFWPRPTHVIVPSSPEPEPPSPAASAVRCFTCGDRLDPQRARPVPGGFFNHLPADWDICRLQVLTVRRACGVA